MAKKPTGESDEIRLKKKLAARTNDAGGSSNDSALRSLRKRLKRVQRKRRALSLRKKHAAGTKAEAKS